MDLWGLPGAGELANDLIAYLSGELILKSLEDGSGREIVLGLGIGVAIVRIAQAVEPNAGWRPLRGKLLGQPEDPINPLGPFQAQQEGDRSF